jgi:hypothetical protein
MARVLAADPEIARIARLVFAMRSEIGLGIESALTAREIAERAMRAGGYHGDRPEHPLLREALSEYERRGAVNPELFAKGLLRAALGRVVSDDEPDGDNPIRLRLAKFEDKHRKIARYFIEAL